MSLSDLSIRRPVFIIMVISALMVLGLISYARLPVELFPNVQFPFVTVLTSYPGAGPEEVATLITRPIEEQVSSLTNVRRVSSSSAEGLSIIGIEFNLGTDIAVATADVRQRVDLVKGTFPRDARDPTVQKFDFSLQPVMLLAVGGSLSGFELRQLAEDIIKPTLERVDGVAAVNISGGRQREIRVAVDQDRLRAFGVSVLQVEDALRRENLNIAGWQKSACNPPRASVISLSNNHPSFGIKLDTVRHAAGRAKQNCLPRLRIIPPDAPSQVLGLKCQIAEVHASISSDGRTLRKLSPTKNLLQR